MTYAEPTSVESERGRSQPRLQNAIECESVSKSFGGQTALYDVSLSIGSGQVHGLVGQNGAGKSSLLGVLTGRIRPDGGHVTIDGAMLHLGAPRASRAAGVACVYQQLTMAPNLRAWENVFLGQMLTRAGQLAAGRMRARFAELCETFGLDVDPEVATGSLSVAQQQILEILRAVQSGAHTLLLDEPTAALPISERDRLYELVRTLRVSGKTVVLVSHNLSEVLGNSQVITVMRNGAVVETLPADQWTEDSLIERMAGARAPMRTGSTRPPAGALQSGAPLLQVRNLRFGAAAVVDRLELHRGEVLGIAGLVGSGRTSLLRALAGLNPESRGDLVLNGHAVQWPRGSRQALSHGIALVPEDRASALVMGMSVRDNLGLGYSANESQPWLLSGAHRTAYAGKLLQGQNFDASRLRHPVKNLSGGNQQKVLIAKWAGRDMDVLMADDPTQAVDVVAKAEVLQRLRQLADQGGAVIFASSEIDEILAICDRAVVMARGRVVGQVPRDALAWNHSSLLRMSFGKTGEGEVL